MQSVYYYRSVINFLIWAALKIILTSFLCHLLKMLFWLQSRVVLSCLQDVLIQNSQPEHLNSYRDICNQQSNFNKTTWM